MAEVKKQLQNSNGENQLAGTMMAALIQAKSGVPADMIVADPEDRKAFDFSGLLSIGKKKEERPDATAHHPEEAETKEPATQTSLAEATIEEAGIETSAGSHIPISAALGIVHVPAAETSLGDWVSTVQLLVVNGYASLGNETVILLHDGTMYRNGDIWQLENKGYQYRFSIDKVTKSRVHLTGIDRIELAEL